MKISKNLIIFSLLLLSSQSILAQTASMAASIQPIPASEIMSVPMGTFSDPIESLQLIPLANAGSWSNNAAGPTLYSKGVFYYLNLNPVGAIPSNATITSVVWNWGLSYKPSGLIVYLCHETTSSCINITNYQSSSTTTFNGRLANKKLIYAFGVSGSGALSPPAYGQMDQVIVNYQY